MMTILLTGAAGFIGFHLTKRLLEDRFFVVGIDNLNDYYDTSLKQERLNMLQSYPSFAFRRANVEDQDTISQIFQSYMPSVVIHLAAQAGVRYSLKNPHAYIQSNIVGFLNIMEGCRQVQCEHLIYASSSSVYGANTAMPFSVRDNVDHPVSLYAATKKSNELMAHTYSHLYGLPTTGLRFFTVYGPWGRPDMALLTFTKAIVEGRPIQVYNEGKMKRDFTYIDDIVEAVVRLLPLKPAANPAWRKDRPDPGSSYAPYRVCNIGNNQPVDLLSFISILEEKLNRRAVKEFLPLQAGDVPETYAAVDELTELIHFSPATPIEVGISRFVDWYTEYYGVQYV